MSNYFNLLKCRVCLGDFYCSNTSLIFVPSESNAQVTHADMIMECASVQLEKDDGYPENICESCLTKLTNSYEFKKLCEYSDKILRSSYVERHNGADESKGAITIEQEKFSSALCDLSDADDQLDESSYSNSAENNEIAYEKSPSVDDHRPNDDNEYSDNDEDEEMLSSRIKKHNEKYHQCSKCDKKYVSSKYLRMHALTHTRNARKQPVNDEKTRKRGKTKESTDGISKEAETLASRTQYPCCFCDKSFIDSIYLINHVQRMHRNTNEGLHGPTKFDDDTLDLKYPCCFCDKNFPDTALLVNHVQKEHKNLGKAEINELMSAKQKKLKCQICDVTFDSGQVLREHYEKTHSVDGVYACKECDKKYMSIKYLEEHSLLHGNKVHLKKLMKKKPRRKKTQIFECNECGIQYTDKRSLLSHETLHNPLPKKLNLCPYCGGNFQNPSSLKEHIRIHTGEKRFKCTICERKFTHYSSLRTHRFIHTGEKNYSCEICGKAFYASSRLTQHKKTHSDEKNYPCEMCEKRFKYKNLLKRHMAIHTDAKRFKCNVCSKEFHFKKNLAAHTRLHTNTTTSNNKKTPSSTMNTPNDSVPPEVATIEEPLVPTPIIEELKPIIDDAKSNVRYVINQGFVQPQYLSVFYANH